MSRADIFELVLVVTAVPVATGLVATLPNLKKKLLQSVERGEISEQKAEDKYQITQYCAWGLLIFGSVRLIFSCYEERRKDA